MKARSIQFPSVFHSIARDIAQLRADLNRSRRDGYAENQVSDPLKADYIGVLGELIARHFISLNAKTEAQHSPLISLNPAFEPDIIIDGKGYEVKASFAGFVIKERKYNKLMHDARYHYVIFVHLHQGDEAIIWIEEKEKLQPSFQDGYKRYHFKLAE